MKKLTAILVASFIAFALTACGSNTDTTNKNTDQQNQQKDGKFPSKEKEAASQQDMKSRMDKLPYSEYELEIRYANDKKYEAEIEHDDDTGKLTSTLKDELHNTHLKGVSSFNKLYPGLKKLDIDGNTKTEDAISQALKAFNLPKDYQKVELTLENGNGKKLEFKDHK